MKTFKEFAEKFEPVEAWILQQNSPEILAAYQQLIEKVIAHYQEQECTT